jgi:putative NIF3 family GTP cyclohydrolase 1 type 2
MTRLSRREFGAFTVSAMAGPVAFTRPLSAHAPISAAEVIERIRKNIGVDWKTDTVDAIKAGDSSMMVSAAVTTAMASMTVLRQAADAGANLVITCEPTFYGRSDARNPPAGRGGGRGTASAPASPQTDDPVFAAKNAFIEKHGLVVFRLSDHWRVRRPDPFSQGLGRALGWSDRQAPADGSRYTIPALSLATLAGELKRKLRSRGGIRVVGDPQSTVRTVALLPGSTSIAAALDVLPSVDVIVAGEVREWESVEYARDVAFSGRRKGLVLLGRIVSEEGGMSECARWLARLVPEVRVRHVAAGDPYWTPA